VRDNIGANTVVPRFWEKVDKTVRHHANGALRAVRGWWWEVAGMGADRPIFVVGCSRAGTTLVYKTFSESKDLGTLQRETHDFWSSMHPLAERRWKSHALSATDASHADRDFVVKYFYGRTGHRRFADKNNQNGFCIPYLQALFPEAYFVYVKRSPGDNINSLIEGWRRPQEFATWSEDLPARVCIDDGKIQRWCFFLPPGWREYVNAPLENVCAYQYRSMNEAILHARSAVPPEQWMELRYEDLLRDPVSNFRSAFEKAGLTFTAELETHCATVLKRPYNAFSEIRLDKWRDSANRERIERVLPTVRDVARQMGYADLSSG
jgi:hypothetical protein